MLPGCSCCVCDGCMNGFDFLFFGCTHLVEADAATFVATLGATGRREIIEDEAFLPCEEMHEMAALASVCREVTPGTSTL